MNTIKYDEVVFEQFYLRLVYQKTNSFFCIVADTIILQRNIANDMNMRFSDGEVQIIDFLTIDPMFMYSSEALINLKKDQTKFLFLINFQSATRTRSESEFFQTLNLSRDVLAELPCVLVFMMPMYFRILIAKNAPDFNSFFQYRVDFLSIDDSNIYLSKPFDLDPTNSVKAELLEYYQDRFHRLKNLDTKQAFELACKIIQLNGIVQRIPTKKMKEFHKVFDTLLPLYRKDDEQYFDEDIDIYD